MIGSLSRRKLKPVWRARVDEYASDVAWSHDGHHLAVGAADGAVTIWQASGERVAVFKAHEDGLNALAWSPTHRTLVTVGQDGVGRLWPTGLGGEAVELKGDDMWVEHVAWSLDGRVVATASGRVVRLWNHKGEPLALTPRHEGTITGLAWRHDNTLFASFNKGLSAWREDGALHSTHAWPAALTGVSVRPRGDVVICTCVDNAVIFWRDEATTPANMGGYPRKPRSVAWSADQHWFATSGDTSVVVWDFKTGPENQAPVLYQGHKQIVTQVASHTAHAIFASGDISGDVKVWNFQTKPRRARNTFREHAGISGLAWHPKIRSLAVVTEEGDVSRWHFSDKKR